jgi:DNA-binding protein YbaB
VPTEIAVAAKKMELLVKNAQKLFKDIKEKEKRLARERKLSKAREESIKKQLEAERKIVKVGMDTNSPSAIYTKEYAC